MRYPMYEQDYILRMINDLVRFLSRIIFKKESPIYEISLNEEYAQTDVLHKNLLALLADGKINEAEDMLFEEFNPKENRDLMVALDFYNRLNTMDEDYLQANNFSKEEIAEGLRDMAKRAGLSTYEI